MKKNLEDRMRKENSEEENNKVRGTRDKTSRRKKHTERSIRKTKMETKEEEGKENKSFRQKKIVTTLCLLQEQVTCSLRWPGNIMKCISKDVTCSPQSASMAHRRVMSVSYNV
jgi:hypothetical protein